MRFTTNDQSEDEKIYLRKINFPALLGLCLSVLIPLLFYGLIVLLFLSRKF